jgi:hypothetical protein
VAETKVKLSYLSLDKIPRGLFQELVTLAQSPILSSTVWLKVCSTQHVNPMPLASSVFILGGNIAWLASGE